MLELHAGAAADLAVARRRDDELDLLLLRAASVPSFHVTAGSVSLGVGVARTYFAFVGIGTRTVTWCASPRETFSATIWYVNS